MNRDQRIQIRVSQEEKELIAGCAQQYETSLSHFLRQMALHEVRIWKRHIASRDTSPAAIERERIADILNKEFATAMVVAIRTDLEKKNG